MQRIYLENLSGEEEKLSIKNKEILNQFIKVLRVKTGDKVIFFNGKESIDHIFQVKNIEKKEIVFEKKSLQSGEGNEDELQGDNKNSEIDFTLNLFQAIPNKLEKIEYILQKGTEIGISNFYFFKAERSQKLHLSENKLERLKKIVIEAVEQSGRNFIPKIIFQDITQSSSFLSQFSPNLTQSSPVKERGDSRDEAQSEDQRGELRDENIFFHTDGEKSLKLKDLKIDYSKNINLFVGPEGGFSEKEILQFEKKGFKKVFLGNRVLRTETTGIVAGFFIIQNK